MYIHIPGELSKPQGIQLAALPQLGWEGPCLDSHHVAARSSGLGCCRGADPIVVLLSEGRLDDKTLLLLKLPFALFERHSR